MMRLRTIGATAAMLGLLTLTSPTRVAAATIDPRLIDVRVSGNVVSTGGADTATVSVLATIDGITDAEDVRIQADSPSGCGVNVMRSARWSGMPGHETWRATLSLRPCEYDIHIVVFSRSQLGVWGDFTPTTIAAQGFPSHFSVINGPAPQQREFHRSGYWLSDEAGTVYPFGDAPSLDKTQPGYPPIGRVVALLHRAGAADYALFSDAGIYHSFYTDSPNPWVVPYTSSCFLPAPPPTGHHYVTAVLFPDAEGCWAFSDNGIVTTSDAGRNYGDLSALQPLNAPIIDAVATPTGRGYYLVAQDGGVFTFGDAVFHGSMGGHRLNGPVMGLVPDSDNEGYWLVASDGGIFAFDAPFKGSMGGTPLNKPVVGMVRYGSGYLMVGADGGVFNFSGLPFSGSLGSTPPALPITRVTPLDE